ncbi:MAG: hypothetical protein M1335_01525 [Chloroflexi bacterium]|nr:hypothetical protein [Chloroflexota bacterium]MCL5026438.1 hypothetical protein [Chloroflexota bacterium]
MVKRMRLPLLIAVVVIVALLLPGPAIVASGDFPRLTGTTSFVAGTPGVKVAYGAKADAKAGTITFVGKAFNTQANVNWTKVVLSAKVPDGLTLEESWCTLPGTTPGSGPDANGYVQWMFPKKAGSETSIPMCGFTVSGWDGKSTVTTGWIANWAGSTGGKAPGGVSTWVDASGGVHSDSAVTVNFPFDSTGFVKVIGNDDKFDVPTKATFQSLEKRVKALEASAGIPSGQDE